MAKVLIYEDSESDLISRYSSLTKKHDVHVRHNPRGRFGPSSLRWDYELHFRESGFNPENFQNGYGNPKEESADVYFLDGLNGYCLEIIEQLPRDRAFINTDSNSIREEATKRGFNLVTEPLEDIILRVGERKPSD